MSQTSSTTTRTREQQPIQSMTGFASVEGKVAGQKLRIEAKSLNHRFLDLKLRFPREFAPLEHSLRAELQNKFQRGAIEIAFFWIRDEGKSETEWTVQPEVAASYLKALKQLQKKLKLKGSPTLMDMASVPEVMIKKSFLESLEPEALLAEIKPLLNKACLELQDAREKEAEVLIQKAFLPVLRELQGALDRIGVTRDGARDLYHDKIKAKIQTLFDTYSFATQANTALLETRLAQELALILDRTDIEEERVRFKKHLDHFQKTVTQPGQVGRKIDFILQELSREINTLGNKAQDVGISEEVVQVKVRIEQMREQGLNLE